MEGIVWKHTVQTEQNKEGGEEMQRDISSEVSKQRTVLAIRYKTMKTLPAAYRILFLLDHLLPVSVTGTTAILSTIHIYTHVS